MASPQHPLLEPKILAAFGVAGFGASVGFGLMLAKILILPGLFISLATAAAIIWLYWADWKAGVRALSSGQPYNGADVKALIIAITMIAVIIPVAINIFIAVTREIPTTNKPILAVQKYEPESIADNKINLAINVINIGSIGAREVRSIFVGEIFTSTLAPTAIDEIFSRLTRFMQEGDTATKSYGTSNIEPGRGERYHVIDIDKIHNISDLNASTIASKVLIVNGKAIGRDDLFYFFIYSRYSDDLIDDGTYWEQIICGFYIGTDTYYHTCAQGGRPRHVMSHRFE